MNIYRKVAVFTVCTICACVLSWATARAEIVDRIVANVNGEIILYSDLQKQIKLLEKNMPMLDLSDPAKKLQIEHRVLTEMIDKKLADMEAKRLKVNVTNEDLDFRIQRILQQNDMTMAQLKLKVKANGQNMEQFRRQIKRDMEREQLVERVLKSKIVITDQQIDDYLKGEAGESAAAASSRKVHLGLIVLPVSDKDSGREQAENTGRKLLEKLKSGTNFQTLAKQYSKGPAAQNGGDIGYVATDELAPFIVQGIKNLKVGQVSGLLNGPDGYYIIKVFDIVNSKVSKSNAALREKVRKTLYEQELNRRFEEWVHNLESKAFIKIYL